MRRLRQGACRCHECKKHSRLTRREQEVAILVASGLRNKEVANRLHISHHTVRDELSAVFRKLGLRTRENWPGGGQIALVSLAKILHLSD
jgi:DNA-binding CsgD family transcriptional regulator